MNVFEPTQGEKITIYNVGGEVIAEGIYLRHSLHPDEQIIEYELRERKVVIRGEHVVKINRRAYRVSDPS